MTTIEELKENLNETKAAYKYAAEKLKRLDEVTRLLREVGEDEEGRLEVKKLEDEKNNLEAREAKLMEDEKKWGDHVIYLEKKIIEFEDKVGIDSFREIIKEEQTISVSASSVGLPIVNKIKTSYNLKSVPFEDEEFSDIDDLDVPPYSWMDDFREDQQMDYVKDYLLKYLPLPRKIILKDVHASAQFEQGFPRAHVKLTAKPDFVLMPSSSSDIQAHAIVLIETKKHPAYKDIHQAEMQLLTVGSNNLFHTIVVLTDLNDYWKIFWLAERSVDSMKIIGNCNLSRGRCMQLIHKVLLQELSILVNMGALRMEIPKDDIFDKLPLKERVKLDLISDVLDLGNVEDFWDDMTKEEKKNYKMRAILTLYQKSLPPSQQSIADPFINQFRNHWDNNDEVDLELTRNNLDHPTSFYV